MKKITTVVLLLFTSILLAQHKNVEIKETINTNTDVKVTSMSYSVDSAKQLENINWNEVKSIFEDNNPEEKIELSFELDLKESKSKFKSAVTVGGKTKEIDSLILKSKKYLKALIKISKNYENK